MRLRFWTLTLLASSLGGCTMETSVPVSGSCWAQCRGALTDAQVSAQLGLQAELSASLSDLVAADTAFAAASGSLGGFVQALATGTAGPPSGYSHLGYGVYRASPNADTRIDVRYYLSEPTSFGQAGDPIPFDLFDSGNYFTGLTAQTTTTLDLDGLHTQTSLAFSGVGPGVELLGLGANPLSPIPLDLGAMSARLTSIKAGATITVRRVNGPTTISYTLSLPPTTASAVGGTRFPLTLQGLSVSRSDTGQTATLDKASLFSTNGGAGLDGALLFRSLSPTFDFQLLFGFSGSAQANVALGCQGVTLSLSAASSTGGAASGKASGATDPLVVGSCPWPQE